MQSNKRRKHSVDEDSNDKKIKANGPSYALLETIDKKKLDFDFEKSCSVSLSNLNVYCCLVCGKYLHGRQSNTPAFLHSVNDGHHVYVNFSNLKFYLLPEGIEIEDKGTLESLNSLRYAIRPTFADSEIAQFPQRCYDLHGNQYTNGFVGMNDNVKNKAINVALQAISHVLPIRDYLLLGDLDKECQFMRRLGLIVRKLWSVRLFKPHISAEEFVSFALVNDSKAAQHMNDPRRCLLWLFDCMSKYSPALKELAEASCRGKVLTTKTMVKAVYDEAQNVKEFIREDSTIEKVLPFWMLTLELPPKPLFKKGLNVNDLPQIRLEELMNKFNGQQEKQMSHHILKYRVTEFPEYLVLHFDRFDRKAQLPVKDRNQTIVEFPLEMEFGSHRYTLIANIIHVGVKPSGEVGRDEESRWVIQLYDKRADKWVELDGSRVRARDRELLFLNETYIQIWQQVP